MSKLWRIWSIEHDGWWRPNEMGYTPYRDEAGLYSFERAEQICLDANRFRGRMPNEAMVPVDDPSLEARTEEEQI